MKDKPLSCDMAIAWTSLSSKCCVYIATIPGFVWSFDGKKEEVLLGSRTIDPVYIEPVVGEE